ncbi:MAG: NosD domain-containing protein [archaeon]
MKKEMIVFTLLILLSIALIHFISADFVDDGTATQNVTDCGTLNTSYATYTLNQSLGSGADGDCLTITNESIILDCAGYNITYGNATGGAGIYIFDESTGTTFNNITIKNCIIIQNTTGEGDAGIQVGANSTNITIYNNTILTIGADSKGISFNDNSTGANVTLNTITTLETEAYGIMIDQSATGGDINLNSITTSGTLAYGILFGENGTSANINSNTITTSGEDASGIKMADGSSGLVYNNTVTAIGNWSTTNNTAMGGIWLESNTDGINVSTNTIIMSGYDNAGIWVWSCYNHSIENNVITATGLVGDGIFLSDLQGVNITSNTINATGNLGNGIYSINSETPLLFYANIITTSGTYVYGFNLNQDSNSNFTSNNITTSGTYAYGIYSNQSHNNTFANNIIETGSATSYILYLTTSGNQSIYNNIFNTSTSGSGVFINDSNLNYFNTTNTTSTNIVGKTYIGGNFWTNINGSGYSDSCASLNADYFCDSEYRLISNRDERDYLPLTNYISTTSACGTLSTANRYYSLNTSLSSNGTCFNITANGITLDFAGFTITGNTTNHGINITGYNSTTVLNGTISNFSNGIYISSSSSNSFTSININNSRQDAVLLAGATSDNNNFTSITITNTNSSYLDINFSTAGIDGTRIEGINFANYSFAGAGGKVIFEEPSFGEIVFLEAINGTGTHLSSDVDVENNSVFVNSSNNAGLNKSANISFYSVSFTTPKIQYSSDNVAWTNCTTATNPTCVNFSFTTGGTFTFNVSHFTYFKIIEGYSAPATATDTTTSSSGGGGSTISTYYPTKNQLAEGYTLTIPEDTKVKFYIGNESHELTINSIDNTSVIITVSSEPQRKTLNVNDEAKFELTDDNFYDFSVKLESATNSTAKLLMKTISEEILVSEINNTQTQETANQTQVAETLENNKAPVTYWAIVVVIAIISIIVIFYYYKKIR